MSYKNRVGHIGLIYTIATKNKQLKTENIQKSKNIYSKVNFKSIKYYKVSNNFL